MTNLPFKKMSVRLAGCLNKAGFFSYEDLKEKNVNDLLGIKNLGRKSLRELKNLIYKENPNIRWKGNLVKNHFLKNSRYEAVYILVKSGKTLQEVGDIFGVTEERVRQMIEKTKISSVSWWQRILNKLNGIWRRFVKMIWKKTKKKLHAITRYAQNIVKGKIIERDNK